MGAGPGSDEEWPRWLPLFFGLTTICAVLLALANRDALFPPGWATLVGIVLIAPCLCELFHWMVPRSAYAVLVLAGITAMMLTDPVEIDLTVLLLYLMVGEVAATAGPRTSIPAAVAAGALLVVLDVNATAGGPWIWTLGVGVSWQIGLALRQQQQALVQERRLRSERMAQAAATERQRIAREIHDVVAHSLSVTMLHLTAARHALVSDRDVDEAVEALAEAEQVGRLAMSDIRRTVGLLTATSGPTAALPSAVDVSTLLDELAAAGEDVTYEVRGEPAEVPAAAGLGLYRIVQESLANVVKHAPGSRVVALLDLTTEPARLTVRNTVPAGPVVPALGPAANGGAGIPGMRQRAELLGGSLTAGPDGDDWLVTLTFPATAGSDEGGAGAERTHTGAAGR